MTLFRCKNDHTSSVTRMPNAEGVRRCYFCPEVTHPQEDFALALLGLWGAEGSECAHGVGLEADCPGELADDGETTIECHWQEFRPALRAALASTERKGAAA